MAKKFEALYEEYRHESLNNIHPILDCMMLYHFHFLTEHITGATNLL